MTWISPPPLVSAPDVNVSRQPCANGKFIYIGDEKFYIRGVTYGTFRPDSEGDPYPLPEVVHCDFAQMADNGVNTIRTYTVPPQWLLDAAWWHGLRVMVGLPWEQHIAFLEDRQRAQSIEERVYAGMQACAGHPAVLSYAIGNEIPASIVRWHGPRRVERFLERLYHAAKSADPHTPATYVNYPSTEYLHLPFLDFVCFNVYLESQERFTAYLAHLQNIAGDRPLVMGEVGLDSHRHGVNAQACTLGWQIRSAFTSGCAGAFVFAWTDEWHRGGHDVEDWDFGLTDRKRRAKPALAAVGKAFGEVPFPSDHPWSRISVVVCSYNGKRTIRDCCEGLRQLEYPDFEVIVVDDGSNDETAAIASEFGFRVMTTENRGLSSARNTGMEAATGQVVAYIDDDARPDPHWLMYLAATFMNSDYAAVGGPNLPPPGDGLIADCVANAPGGPVHVLLSACEAEHIPGCNMAFRKSCLQAIGGFDPQFRVAGDDVDVCWRLQQRGWTLGFSPGAVVWHHRRNSVRAFWKQQFGYGRAEACLEQKWPEKYNGSGQLSWAGRLYDKAIMQQLSWRRQRIYQGVWGTAPFQFVYPPSQGGLLSLSLTPEWYLVIAVLAALAALGVFWKPLIAAAPLLVLSVALLLVQAGWCASQSLRTGAQTPRYIQAQTFCLTAFLHLMQPLARLSGRLNGALSTRQCNNVWDVDSRYSLPWPRSFTLWSQCWQAVDVRLRSLATVFKAHGMCVLCGGDYDDWDLEVRGGRLATTRLRMAIEEHGAGRQLVRVRAWPRFSPGGLILTTLLGLLFAGAAVSQGWLAAVALGVATAGVAMCQFRQSCAAMAEVVHGLRAVEHQELNRKQATATVKRFAHRRSRRRSPMGRVELKRRWNYERRL